MNSTRSLLGSLWALTLLAAFACDSQTNEQSSSSTHWVTCDTDQDCALHPSHPTCDAGYCVNESGERLEDDQTTGGRGPVPGATGGNAPSFGGALNPTNGGSSPVASGGAAVSGAGGEPTSGGAAASGAGGEPTSGGAAVSGAGGEQAGGNGGDPGSSTEGGASGVEPGSACSGPEPYTRPDLDKTCETSSDCFAGRHLVDCCGTTLWLAYSEAARADFEQAESGCTATCPCPIRPTRAEDGAELDPADAVADCVDGRCMARHPDNAGECLGPGECIDLDTGLCLGAEGPLIDGICRGAGGVCILCECASPDTPVATPKGDVAISELHAGDLVYSIDGAAIRAVPITAVHRNPVEHHRVVEVRLESGAVLAISASHPIADGRTFAELRAGTALGDSQIASVRLVPYSHPFTYDILPDSDTGVYFVAGAALGSTLRIGAAQSLPR